MAKKNKKIKDPNKKSKAPFILLPISMVTAGVAKIVTIIIGAIGFGLFAWLYYDYGFIKDLIPDIFGEYSYYIINLLYFLSDVVSIGVILLFGLFNKGFTKKLQFVSSAFVGNIAFMFATNYNIFSYGLGELKQLMPYDVWDFMSVVEVVVPILVTIVSFGICFVISVLISVFVFKALSKYTEAPKVEGEKSFKLKKMIVPAFLISGTAAIYPVFYFIEDIIYENIGFESYFISSLFSNAWYFAGRLLGLGILLGSIFILKDKYRALTCLAAASTGVLLFPQSISSTLGNIPIAISGGMGGDFYWLLTYILWSIAVAFVGIIFYILLNRKEMKRD